LQVDQKSSSKSIQVPNTVAQKLEKLLRDREKQRKRDEKKDNADLLKILSHIKSDVDYIKNYIQNKKWSENHI